MVHSKTKGAKHHTDDGILQPTNRRTKPDSIQSNIPNKKDAFLFSGLVRTSWGITKKTIV